MKIIVEGELTEQERNELRFLLSDALSEFMTAREGDYVSRRYPEQSELFKTIKRVQVERRGDLARRLKLAASNVEVRDGN